MTTHIDFANPVYWLLIAGGAGALLLLVLGVGSIIAFDRKYKTRAEIREFRISNSVQLSAFDRFFFTLSTITVLLLAVYTALVLALGLPPL